jgi:O-antigen/teichoic acid export membrane protein
MSPSDDGIGDRIRSGVAWKAGSQITLQISRTVVALVLARMLSPHDWGLAAMVLLFSGFVVVFTDNALGTALIQRRELVSGDRSTVFWMSVGAGVLLAVGGVFLAGPLADFYGEPEVDSLFIAASLGFFVSSLGTTHMALLAREMQFRLLELRQIAATIAGAAVGIGLALAGKGAWAIVGQLLAETVISTIALWIISPWRPSATFSMASLKRLGGFAGNVFGENLLYQAGRSLGSLVIGRVLGAAALGAYALATNVILIPFTRLAAPLQQVFFPAFSRMNKDRPRIADVWIRATRLVGFFSIPAIVGVAIVAPDFVQVVLGPRWSEVTPLIRVLAVVGILQSLHTLSVEVLQALAKVGVLLRLTLIWALATLGAVLLGQRWGIVGVATCYAAVTLVIEPIRTLITTRALGIPFWRLGGSLAGIVQATLLMAATAIGVRHGLVAAGIPAPVRLAAVTILGVVVYGAACRWRAPDVIAEIRGALSRRRRPPATRPDVAEATL